MITATQYLQIVTEEYDLSDYATKKKVLFCNEANKTANIEHIVTRLYQHIRTNITDIDFGTIPKSKGIITKIENYDQIVDCLNTINDLVKEYKDPTDTVKEISSAIANIQNRENDFVKAFTLDIEFPMMMYNMTVLSIVSATSLLITSSIEFIKNGHDSFTAAFDKSGYSRTKDHMLFEYITQFNRNCANGVIDKLIKECIKNNITSTNESSIILNEEPGDLVDIIHALRKQATPMTALALSVALPGPFQLVGIVIAIGIAGFMFLRILSKCIMFYLSIRMKVSDWFATQAEFLQINAENLKYRDDEKGAKHKQEVYKKQMKWVERFNKIANKIAIKDTKARKEAEQEEEKSRKRTYEDDHKEENENKPSDNGNNDGGLF